MWKTGITTQKQCMHSKSRVFQRLWKSGIFGLFGSILENLWFGCKFWIKLVLKPFGYYHLIISKEKSEYHAFKKHAKPLSEEFHSIYVVNLKFPNFWLNWSILMVETIFSNAQQKSHVSSCQLNVYKRLQFNGAIAQPFNCRRGNWHLSIHEISSVTFFCYLDITVSKEQKVNKEDINRTILINWAFIASQCSANDNAIYHLYK